VKPWWEQLFDILMGILTKGDLARAGAPPDALGGALTEQMDLPTFGGLQGPPPGLRESRELADCHPELQRRFGALRVDFEREQGRQLIITSTYRSPERQAELYAQGRTAPGQVVTKLDGHAKKSRHNVYPAEALDVAIDVDPGPGKHVSWDRGAFAPLGPLALRHGLVWGGGWTSLQDDPHLELPAGAV
jgi:hypothetical protein